MFHFYYRSIAMAPLISQLIDSLMCCYSLTAPVYVHIQCMRYIKRKDNVFEMFEIPFSDLQRSIYKTFTPVIYKGIHL